MKKKYVRCLLFLLMFFVVMTGAAHQLPTSVLLFDVKTKGIAAELQVPFDELQLSIRKFISSPNDSLTEAQRNDIEAYLRAHFYLMTANKLQWKMQVRAMQFGKAELSAKGKYKVLNVSLWLEAPKGCSVRQFSVYYDAVMHQIAEHQALVAVRQDWDGGRIGDRQTELGVIRWEDKTKMSMPLSVRLDRGSRWVGFREMVKLGMLHISEGTDHLLFLLVLLLVAPMLASGSRWGRVGSTRYGLLRLLTITTAFTIGHSLTLALAALGWLKLPSQLIEILIAVSILITSLHALRPLFANKEIFVASGFGLVHGLAFANTLSDLQLETGRLVLSIFGFNLGIEMMQLFVISVTVPFLFFLSKGRMYRWVRTLGACLSAVAALAWIAERSLQRSNLIADVVMRVAAHSWYIVLLLAFLAVLSFLYSKIRLRFGWDEA